MLTFNKNLFIAIASVFLVSCTDSDSNKVEYENLVLGTWNNYVDDTDSLFMTRVFTDDYYSYFSFAEGSAQNRMSYSKYYLDNTSIYLEKYTQQYKIHSDTLWITNSSGDKTTKYIRASK